MATAKAQDASTNPDVSTKTEQPETTASLDNTMLPAPSVAPVAVPLDFSTSDTWGRGGRFVINEQGQRVPAPTI